MNIHGRRLTRRLAVVAAVVPLGFGMLASVQANSRTNHLARSPILIGQISPLTGPFANVQGPSERAGPVLAVRQINNHGGVHGRPLRLVLVDDRSTNAGGIAALNRLIRIDHVQAIIGPGTSTEILAMAPLIERAGIPMIIGGQAPRTTHEGNPWVFRTRPNNLYEARALTTFAVSTLHLARLALLYNENVVGRDYGAVIRANLKALRVKPVAELTYPVLAADLTAQVLAIKKSGANALISEGSQPADYLLLARQMREVGLHLTWLGNSILALAATRPGGDILQGIYAGTDYAASQSPEATAFNRTVEASYHQPANFASAFTYDGVQILAKVMRKVGTRPRAIRRGILAIRGYRGVEGTYTFDRHGDGLHQYTIVRNLNGKLLVIRVMSF